MLKATKSLSLLFCPVWQSLPLIRGFGPITFDVINMVRLSLLSCYCFSICSKSFFLFFCLLDSLYFMIQFFIVGLLTTFLIFIPIVLFILYVSLPYHNSHANDILSDVWHKTFQQYYCVSLLSKFYGIVCIRFTYTYVLTLKFIIFNSSYFKRD